MRKIQMDNLDNVNGGFGFFDQWRRDKAIKQQQQQIIGSIESFRNAKQKAMELLADPTLTDEEKIQTEEIITRANNGLRKAFEGLELAKKHGYELY